MTANELLIPAQAEHFSLLEKLAALPEPERCAILDKLTPQAASTLLADWKFWARPNQLPPPGKWVTWLIQAGRGWGKTRTGAQLVRHWVQQGVRRVAFVGATSSDVRDVMVEGPSGIIAVSEHDPENERPIYEPGRRRVRWPNGATAMLYSAEEPNRLRGPQHEKAWGDEPAAWQYPETLDQLMFGLRLGHDPQVVLTTTPKPTPMMRDLNKRAVSDVELRAGRVTEHVDVVMTIGTTYENLANLARTFISEVVRKYEGTTLGQQELYAKLIEDVEGAHWNTLLIERSRINGKDLSRLVRIVVAIDPAVTSKKTSAETGIVVVGLGDNKHAYVLSDGSGRFSPNGWARKGVELYHAYNGDRIIGEINNGGDLVETVIRQIDPAIPYKGVNASRGKDARAEPVVGLYEQGKVHHVGYHALLESQMTTWRFDLGLPSPDRMDALVWAITELMITSSGIYIVG